MPCSKFSYDQQQMLLRLARESIRYGVEHHKKRTVCLDDVDEELLEVGCCFVTLHLDGYLRGCIGSLTAYQSLIHDVEEHAYAAAFNDPRFTPVRKEEVERITISISILTPSDPITCKNEKDLLDQLEPGIDGLILEQPATNETPAYKATFLPSVWQQLPDKERFLEELKQKAGLPKDYWSDSLRFERYQTISFSED